MSVWMERAIHFRFGYLLPLKDDLKEDNSKHDLCYLNGLIGNGISWFLIKRRMIICGVPLLLLLLLISYLEGRQSLEGKIKRKSQSKFLIKPINIKLNGIEMHKERIQRVR